MNNRGQVAAPTHDFSFESDLKKTQPAEKRSPKKHIPRNAGVRLRPKSQYKVDDDHLNVIDILRNVRNKKQGKNEHEQYCGLLHGVHETNLQLKHYLATQKEQLQEKYQFQPKINHKSQNLALKLGRDVIERNNNWIEQRKHNLLATTQELKETEEKVFAETMTKPKLLTEAKNAHVVPKVKVYIDHIPKSTYQVYLLEKQKAAENQRKLIHEMTTKTTKTKPETPTGARTPERNTPSLTPDKKDNRQSKPEIFHPEKYQADPKVNISISHERNPQNLPKSLDSRVAEIARTIDSQVKPHLNPSPVLSNDSRKPTQKDSAPQKNPNLITADEQRNSRSLSEFWRLI
jgi:hypothetical protein